ncbi:unnamed protein product [Medioppia subpectinata]|uniref:Snurportin-1 n=1 Tax=Medioppia subpectinata TaxID=1979941 RepID=A0A7R9Q4G7_9ACAR|nr:unnamed protein product [Medioppia subpectinata]CAG2112616.1 unnamed protein product [Medioppia subpectinata]
MSYDDIVESFSESFLLTKEANDTNRCHPKYNHFKDTAKSKECLQEIRRKEFIDNQKKNREQIVMRLRCLLDEMPVEDNACEPMDTRNGRKLDSKLKRFYVNKYKNQLMLSEWLVQIPEDLTTNWFLVLCPIGKRCLVLSSKGQTRAYSRTGYLMATFPTQLPGGNRKIAKDSKHNCILDCIYSESERVYYVLDVMSWNGCHFGECDTDFRFFWLNSKLESECPEVIDRTPLNPYPFVALKHYGCSESEIVSTLRAPKQFSSPVDGLLFYHKRCHYTSGVTPLVNWLKPHMLSDVLNIHIN